MKKILLVTFLLFLNSFITVSGQTSSPNYLEQIELEFSLGKDDKPVEAGFYDPKSNWKLDYQLYLTNSDTLEKLGKCFRSNTNMLFCKASNDKETDKLIRKNSIRISKEKFKRKGLTEEGKRGIKTQIRLKPDAIKIFNEAAQKAELNPVFVMFVRSRASTKDLSKTKFKNDLSTLYVFPMKSRPTIEVNNFNDLKYLSAQFWIK